MCLGLTFIVKVQTSFIDSSQMAFGILFMNNTSVPTYIVCTLKIEGKRYEINKLVVSATNGVATYMQILCGVYAILT